MQVYIRSTLQSDTRESGKMIFLSRYEGRVKKKPKAQPLTTVYSLAAWVAMSKTPVPQGRRTGQPILLPCECVVCHSPFTLQEKKHNFNYFKNTDCIIIGTWFKQWV